MLSNKTSTKTETYFNKTRTYANSLIKISDKNRNSKTNVNKPIIQGVPNKLLSMGSRGGIKEPY